MVEVPEESMWGTDNVQSEKITGASQSSCDWYNGSKHFEVVWTREAHGRRASDQESLWI